MGSELSYVCVTKLLKKKNFPLILYPTLLTVKNFFKLKKIIYSCMYRTLYKGLRSKKKLVFCFSLKFKDFQV